MAARRERFTSTTIFLLPQTPRAFYPAQDGEQLGRCSSSLSFHAGSEPVRRRPRFGRRSGNC